jgi:hypothetical protein
MRGATKAWFRAMVMVGVCVFCIFVSANWGGEAGASVRNTGTGAPDILAGWQEWVLHEQQRDFCPAVADDGGSRVCAFPSQVAVTMKGGGAAFEMLVHVYARERVRLPQAKDVWPQDVVFLSPEGGASPALVLEHGGGPSLLLEPGTHRIQGFLPWAEAPELLRLPPAVGVVTLTRPEGVEPFPDLAEDGALRLATTAPVEERPEDGLEVEIFRLIEDDLPMRVVTLLRLQVSGRARRIELPNVLPADSSPLAVQSPLPLSFAPKDGVFVQARPGRFDLRITSRLPGPVEALGPQPAPFGREFWAFQAHDDLRVVEIHGAPDVDPKTTDLPPEWQGFPAFLVEPGAVVGFKEMHRGAPDAAPDSLEIFRTIWLDFDGKGLTVQDNVNGAIRRDWTLRMLPPGDLGRVSLQGDDQPVVLLGEEPLPGVEIRNGSVNLVAESRYEGFSGELPSTGWDREFDRVTAELRLPPGWRLFTAQGVDGVTQSWISQWTFLDILLCLLIAMLMVVLRVWWLGVLGLLFLLLGYQEPDAPQLTWLFLLGALALVRVFHMQARLSDYHTGRRFALMLYAVALVAMAVTAVPFIYDQVRTGLFPQLEQLPYQYTPPRPAMLGAGAPDMKTTSEPMEMAEDLAVEPESEYGAEYLSKSMRRAPAPAPMKQERAKAPKALMYDPEALVQTGPGLPSWSWRTVSLQWNGPVARGETMSLTLLSPGWGLALSVARVVLLVVVLLLLVDLRPMLRGFAASMTKAAPDVVTFALLSTLLLAAPAVWAATSSPEAAREVRQQEQRPQEQRPQLQIEMGSQLPPSPDGVEATAFPPSWLLEEYKQRLLEPAPCFPDCLSSPHLAVDVGEQRLRLVYTVHAAAHTLAPLPEISERWQPATVLLNEAPARDLYRDKGRLFCALEPGEHRIVLEGPTPKGLSFQIALPLQSRQGEVTAPGWIVQGLGAAGDIQGSLRLAREKADAGGARAPGETYRIPPFLHVERSVTMGLQWTVSTVVRRVSPPGEPVHLKIPLLPGESVLSEDVKVLDGLAQVQFKPGQQELSWNSSMEQGDSLGLRAPSGVPWVETWTLSPSHIWHLEVEGVPAVSVLDDAGNWRPTWRPWPGEEVTLAVSRPKAAPGAAMTIQKAELEMRPGQRLDQNELRLEIRASRGLRHVFTLPADAELTGLRASGRDLPLVGGAPGSVEVPIRPGMQEVRISWRQPREGVGRIQPPQVDLGHPAVNADVRMHVPQDRWILLTSNGPLLGPAVTYWPYLVAALIFAWILNFLPWTPLRLWHWFVLAVGLSQLSPFPALLAVAWLPLLGLKRERYPREGWFVYDVLQLSLAGLVTVGLVCLYIAVENGLLGMPAMQVQGNGSYGQELIWTQDRVGSLLPRPVVLTAPLWMFRVLMLAWSLWLAVYLLKWLRWGWDCLCEGELLRKPRFKRSEGLPFAGRKGGGTPGQQPVEQDDFRLEDADAPERG